MGDKIAKYTIALFSIIIFILLPQFLFSTGLEDEYIKSHDHKSWGTIFSEFFSNQGFNKSYALVIGIGDYDYWKHLEAPAFDAIRFKKFLVENAGFDYVVTLTQEKATLERIRRLMIDVFPNLLQKNDRFLFYFSGHGTQRKIGGRTIGYLPLKNSRKQGYANMIDMDEISKWSSLLAHARQSLFILDACFSGLAGIQTKSDKIIDKRIERLAQYGHYLITAGTANEESVASLKKWGGSLFTDSFLQGASGRADSSTSDYSQDGIVSLKELMKYIEDRIDHETVRLRNSNFFSNTIKMSPQISDLKTNVGEFFFITKHYKNRKVGRPKDFDLVYGVPSLEDKGAINEGGSTPDIPDSEGDPRSGEHGQTNESPVSIGYIKSVRPSFKLIIIKLDTTITTNTKLYVINRQREKIFLEPVEVNREFASVKLSDDVYGISKGDIVYAER
jgi:hypothetical protein